MKRKKHSIPSPRVSKRSNKAKGKVVDELCPYFDNIPSHITVQILLQLPIESLLICKCVCKMWKTLISEPHFAKLHFERRPSLMIRTKDHRVSRTLYLLECQPEKFEIGTDNHVKLQPFKLPLRDANSKFGEKQNKIKNKSKCPYIASKPDLDKFGIVNSCNGLLCLCDPSNGNPLVICNPVTGEFIRLPEATTTPTLNTTRVTREQRLTALGFLPKINEYKVIKMLVRYGKRVNDHESVILEINTLGTPSWRNVEADSQVSIPLLKYPTCVNGALHWIGFEGGFAGRPRSILCFCLESERFQSFPSPPQVFGNHNNTTHGNSKITMGELKGFLYICDSTFFTDVTMWVMNDYGNGESWTKLYNIDPLVSSFGSPDPSPYLSHYGLCFPIKHFEEGAAVLLYHPCNWFIYYEPEKYGFKVFQIQGPDPNFVEIIPHIPSLISLKDVVKGDNIEVLNIHSRCAKFKLHEENEALSLSQPIDGDLESLRSLFYYDSD
ncbi:F-box/kelch-repeat protein At3g06240-like [Trifolium pratense]|uniref:F-box/kelch-repeat protein At3g06240-like n=1 Tax=Trifolium pratense TaxID=57577 RepID=UPI001E692A20|nr:F-box/kelch-repeat protein At3g06240-like [Trifolium pratense]